MKFNYKWKLSDLDKIESNGLKVFSCFACGGGSSMGYKMNGFDVIGINEIDKRMIEVYNANFSPKYVYKESIETFKNRNDLPEELYNLDILDGSPPCSTFSISGSREKAWGKEKVFREGQAKQVLSDLFFDYIDLAKKLQPKVILAENVKGMLQGNAKGYVKMILDKFKDAGYKVQLFLLNSATMGVPQRRERIFFIGLRNDIDLQKLKLEFNEKPILYKDIEEYGYENKIIPGDVKYWKICKAGKSISTVHPKGHRFNAIKLSQYKVVNTIANSSNLYHYKEERSLNNKELDSVGSFPLDYKFLKNKHQYLIGMSVPPLMIQKISEQIYKQWLSKI